MRLGARHRAAFSQRPQSNRELSIPSQTISVLPGWELARLERSICVAQSLGDRVGLAPARHPLAHLLRWRRSDHEHDFRERPEDRIVVHRDHHLHARHTGPGKDALEERTELMRLNRRRRVALQEPPSSLPSKNSSSVTSGAGVASSCGSPLRLIRSTSRDLGSMGPSYSGRWIHQRASSRPIAGRS